jgi:tetratricopeptide (TPR) repeat protein
VQQREATGFDLTEYGISFQAEPRIIIMMAALEAAGFDPVPEGAEPSVFRAQVRKDLSSLDPDLRNRLRAFYERNKLPSPATAADQSARYISLALALGPPPSLDAPPRTDDLPASLLEVLDFAPLVKEFYLRSRIGEILVSYTRVYQAEGERLQMPTAEMVRAVLSYLHTRPITVSVERILVKTPKDKRKNAPRTYTTREHQRRFVIVPDLLGAPGAINFRVIGDEYFAVLPERTDPASSELRRGYLQYVIDPLMLRFNREIAARRDQIKQVLAEREKAGTAVTPDIFLVVSRSLVAAADERFEEVKRLETLSLVARERLANAKDEATRKVITKDFQAATNAIQDESIARLAEQYEQGAVLDFFFAEQLKGIESSGFDVANFLVDMISSFDPAREVRRLTENAEARQRALAARQARLNARMTALETPVYSEAETTRAAVLVKKLAEIEQILRLKDYNIAEAQLKDLLKDYSREPRIFFALAQTASIAAADATDEDVQAERLKRALANYRFALEASSPETDRALISRAHEAMGRIYAFLGNTDEAAKEFDKAIAVGEVTGGAHKEAKEGRKKLAQPR